MAAYILSSFPIRCNGRGSLAPDSEPGIWTRACIRKKRFALQRSIALDPLGALVRTLACYFPFKRTERVVGDLYTALAFERRKEEELYSARSSCV